MLAGNFKYVWEQTHCGGAVAAYSSWTLENQEKWLSGQAANKTEYEVLDSICEGFADRFSKHGFTKSGCLDAMNDSKYEMQARISWKYASNNRVTGTPTIKLNGVTLDSHPSTEAEWANFLKEYLPDPTSDL